MFAIHQHPTVGNPTVEFIGNITLFLVLLINANLCKFLINFSFFFSNGALYHLNVKFRSPYIQKRLLRNIWSIPATLQKCSKIMRWKILEVLTRVHMWDYYFSRQKQVIQDITFVRKGKPRLCWQLKPQSSKTQDFRSNKIYESVLILSAC